MKKLIVFVIEIVLIIWLGIAIWKNINGKTVSTSSNKLDEKTKNEIKNVDNTIAENNLIQNNITNQKDENNTTEKVKEDKIQTDLERAVSIVKKDWGEDTSVYFSEDGRTENEEYIICVRDKNTTSAKAWYIVDLEKGTAERWD